MIGIKKEKLLLKPKDIKASSKEFEVLGTLNPAAIRLPNGQILLYLRVIEKLKVHEDDKYAYAPRMIGHNEFKYTIDRFKKDDIKESSDLDILFTDGTKRLKFISHFRRVYLDRSGFNIVSIDKKPSFYGLLKDGELGVEDPRITKIYNYFVMTYVSLTKKQNISTCLAISRDGINWTRKGIIFGEMDKDVVIFPEKVHGKYIAFDRPEGSFRFSAPHIWIAYSKDLTSWGELKPIDCVYEEKGSCPRNGAGPPPIRTSKGWLLLYHTVLTKEEVRQEVKDKDGKILKIIKIMKDLPHLKKDDSPFVTEVLKRVPQYIVGASLFDIDNPEKMIAKSKTPLLIPKKKYEMGTFEDKDVIFPTGLVQDNNGKDILIYSGAGDVYTTVKKVSLSSVLKSLKPMK